LSEAAPHKEVSLIGLEIAILCERWFAH